MPLCLVSRFLIKLVPELPCPLSIPYSFAEECGEGEIYLFWHSLKKIENVTLLIASHINLISGIMVYWVGMTVATGKKSQCCLQKERELPVPVLSDNTGILLLRP